MENHELYHYGTLGMRWGIRRYQQKDGTLTDKGRTRMMLKARKLESKAGRIVPDSHRAKVKQAKLTQKAKDLRRDIKTSDLTKARLKKDQIKEEVKKNSTKPKKLSEMTDAEIQARIDRMKLEASYHEWANKPGMEKQKSKGQELIQKIMDKSLDNIGTQTATYLVGKGVNRILAPIFNDPQVINPKKGQKDK